MEDGISKRLQHRHKMCYEKGGRHESMDLYVLEVVSPWGHYFWTGGLAYNSIPPLGLSLRGPIEFIQSPIGFIQEFHDST